MKNKMTWMLVLILTGVMVAASQAQPGRYRNPGRPMSCIQDLSEEQQEQIDALNTELQKARLPIKSEMEVLSAELKKLCIADLPDAGRINEAVEQMGEYRTALHKLRVQNRMKIRSLLTPDQRVQFDARCFSGRRHHGMRGQRKAGRGGMRGQGMGMGPGAGMNEPEDAPSAE